MEHDADEKTYDKGKTNVCKKIYFTFIGFIYFFFAVIGLIACENNVVAEEPSTVEVDDLSSSSNSSSSSLSPYPESFKPDSQEYPYAGIPRIVIETEYRTIVNDRESEIPAKLQIWGKKEAESDILDLTIRGRGNTSWENMPKKSYKIEFSKKQSFLEMPSNKDWVLQANYADKTLLKNYLVFQLAKWLGSAYPPRCEFAELYLNGEYLGVYLIIESIKQGKNRVNISDNDSYIVEFDCKKKTSDVGTWSKAGKFLNVHYPKQPTDSELNILRSEINRIENILQNRSFDESTLSSLFDLDAYISYYWIQEFSKNPDAFFATSVYFSWEVGKPLKMGPVWDFDLAFGVHSEENKRVFSGWFINQYYWNIDLFSDNSFKNMVAEYWEKHRNVFSSTLDSLEIYRDFLYPAANNNFKRWNILKNTQYVYFRNAYSTYGEAVDDMMDWIRLRINWIENNL